jgi:tRNA U34 5-methylaminomethyl-2-thiouridine-forming methyltransferase MnmC
MEFAEVIVEATEDGSSTLRSLKFCSTYHSSHGALQESMHVFIQNGLDSYISSAAETIRVLEIGFGTGLNALLAWKWAKENGKDVEYIGVEAFPVNPGVLGEFQYLLPNASQEFQDLHNTSWNEPHVRENFKFTKLLGNWPEIHVGEGFDIIFFDAFSPNDQPELWNEESLQACRSALKDGGVWVTYCAKGEVRRTMESFGFTVKRLPGPPFKRHMLHATKNGNSISL